MNNSATEVRLLERAVDAFFQQTGMAIELQEMPNNLKKVDAFANLAGTKFRLEVKSSVTSQNLYSVIERVSRASVKYSTLLVTGYINPNLMDKLKEANVSCVDTVGNAYINHPPVYVFVKGNKADSNAFNEKTGRFFQYSGLKLIYALLQNPSLIKQPYRDIAEKAGISLGSVGWVLSDLAHEGYVHKSASKRKLADKERLLQNWVEHYPKIKQKHFLGSFTTDDSGWWRNIDIQQYGAIWGGEIAAETLSNYLQAKDGVVFISQNRMGEFVKNARLKKSKAGDDVQIELIEPFWGVDSKQEDDGLAPVLLVYADLINSRDARNLETAQRLYEQYLN